MELKGFYINLKTRTDRMNSFECLKKKYPFFKAIKRIDAIYSNYGPLGCSLSHIKCLNKLQNIFFSGFMCQLLNNILYNFKINFS